MRVLDECIYGDYEAGNSSSEITLDRFSEGVDFYPAEPPVYSSGDCEYTPASPGIETEDLSDESSCHDESDMQWKVGSTTGTKGGRAESNTA